MKKRFNLLTSSVFIAVAVFSLGRPASLKYIGMGWLSSFAIVFHVVLIVFLLVNATHYSISKYTLIICTMFFAMAVSTFIHCANYDYLIETVGPPVAACLFTDCCMQKCPKKYVCISMYILEFLFIINVITMIIFPKGMFPADQLKGNWWFLGYDNTLIYMLIPYVGFSLIYSQIQYGKYITIHSVTALIIAVLTEFLPWSATGIVLVVLLMICVFGNTIPIIKRIFHPKVLVGLFYIGTILIVFFRITEVFEPFIVNVLKKDITFTGRTNLWDYVIDEIKDSWLIGFGQGGTNIWDGWNALHPHCLILDLLYKGGVLMLLPFIWLVHKFTKFSSRHIDLPIIRIVYIVIATILFGEIVNSTQGKPFFWEYFSILPYVPRLYGLEDGKSEVIRLKI